MVTRISLLAATALGLMLTAGASASVHNGRLAYLASDGDLVVSRADGSGVRTLTGSARSDLPHCTWPCQFGGFAWSPDGRRLAFIRGDIGSGPNCASNCRKPKGALFVIGADGRGERLLERCNGPCAGLSWAPDGKWIALAAARKLVAVDSHAGSARTLAPGQVEAPAWSPDGATVAFVSRPRVFRVNAAGRPVVKRLAPTSADNLSWAPDSRSVVIGAGDDLFRVGADGSKFTRLLHGAHGSGPGAPSFSPDGTRVLFFQTPGTPGQFRVEVWTMRPDGSGRVRIFAAGCCVGIWEPPIWSPDGKRVVIAADAAGGTVITDATGGNGRVFEPFVTDVAWQPVR